MGDDMDHCTELKGGSLSFLRTENQMATKAADGSGCNTVRDRDRKIGTGSRFRNPIHAVPGETYFFPLPLTLRFRCSRRRGDAAYLEKTAC